MKLVFATSLYDLSKRGSDRHRTVDWLLEHGRFVLDLPYELAIFADPELAEAIRVRRPTLPTTIFTVPLEDLVASARAAAILRGRIQDNATRSKVTPSYIHLMWAKYEMVRRASDLDATHVGWIDLAIAHVAKTPPPGTDIFAVPSDLPRVHMLRYFDTDDTSASTYHHNVQGHLAGGLVVGEAARMRHLCEEFWAAVDRAIDRGLAPLDEGLLTEVVSRNPDDYSYSYGDYCDILTNHDEVRGGAAHLRWETEDARRRGKQAWSYVRRMEEAVIDAELAERDRVPAAPVAVVPPRSQRSPLPPQARRQGDAPPALGLVMIVKDEAHGIAETLCSFSPFVDHWTILDTGSTDGTQEVVRRELGDLPGTLYEEPFVDFASSRNRALDLHGRATIYTIMPDSDDRLVNGPALRDFIDADRDRDHDAAYLVNLRRGDLSYFLPIVLRTAAGWRYQGRVHEYVGPGPTSGVPGDGFARAKIPGVQIAQEAKPRSLEASRRRWVRDLELLRAELVARPDDPRSLFYLAQTHECLGQHEEARLAYERRIEIGGWSEETFEARLRHAKILDVLGRPWPDVQQAYLDAHRIDPGRAEPLFQVAQHWHDRGAHALSYLFARRAAELPVPSSTLFVREDVYAWRAADLAAIGGYYLRDADALAVEKGRGLAERCVRACPGDERLRSNWAFYASSAAQLFEGFVARPIDFTPAAPYVAGNPSILYDQGRWRCVVRTVNYRIVEGRYLTPDDGVIYTRNFMIELDEDLGVTRAVEMVDKSKVPRSAYPVHGFEDCRLFRHGGRLACTSTACDLDLDRAEEGPREIVLLELDAEYGVVAATPLRGPWSRLPQKNWMPVLGDDDGDGPRTAFIYSMSPDDGGRPVVFDVTRDGVNHLGACRFGHGRLRGGSQLVHVPGGWLCVVHDVTWHGGGARVYLHRFVFLSPDLEVVSMSDPFYFQRFGIEFCAGLACDGDRLVASFSVEDRQACFGVFSLARVQERLRRDFVI